MTQRTVLFGGTFDPVHKAHIAVARAALEKFHPRRILFVPAARPPHKGGGAHAGFEDRARMLELACADEPRFEVSRIEKPRDGRDDPSYSILTVEALLASGEGPVDFLIGADAFAEIRSWHRWRELMARVEFIVVSRPGATFDVPDGARVRELTGMELPESSSAIRARLAAGEFDVPVPAAVLDWIRDHNLYAIGKSDGSQSRSDL